MTLHRLLLLPRWAFVAAVSGLVLSSLVLGFAAPAQAVTAATIPYIPPSSPGALNILPSVFTAGTKAAASSPEALLVAMGRMVKSPEFLAAVRASRAGAATAAQTALVTAEAAAYKVPATVPGTLLKVSSGVGVALFGFEVGTSLGTGASRVLGFKDNQVCLQNNDVLTTLSSVLNDVDCGPWKSSMTEAQRNLDTTSTLKSGLSACNTAGQCIVYLGFKLIGPGYGVACFHTPGDSVGNFVFINGGQSGASVGSSATQYCTGTYPSVSQSKQTASSGGNSLATPTRFGLGSTVAPSAEYIVKSTDVAYANPQRRIRAEIKMADGTKIIGTSSDQFTENDPAFKMAPLPVIPPNAVPDEVKFVESSPGLPDVTIGTQPTTPEYKKYRQDYPECQDGSCILELIKTGVGTCAAAGDVCADWFTDPNKATEYACTFGGKAVVLSECNAYAPMFKPGAKETGQTLANPVTGESAGVKTAPGVSSNLGDAVMDPEKPRDCYPKGWAALNPVEWVLKPVGCALQSAFVPRESVIRGDNEKLRENVAKSALGSIGTVGAALVAFPIVANGCGGVPWQFEVYTLSVDADILSTCPGEPLHDISVQVRGIVVAILWSIAALAWIRYFAIIFGYSGFGSGTPASTQATGPLDTGGGGVHLFPAYQVDQQAIGGGSSSQGAIGGSQRAIGGSSQKAIGS